MKNISEYFNRTCTVIEYKTDGTVFEGHIPLWLDRAAGLVIYGATFYLASQGAKRTWDNFVIYMAKRGIFSKTEE